MDAAADVNSTKRDRKEKDGVGSYGNGWKGPDREERCFEVRQLVDNVVEVETYCTSVDEAGDEDFS